MSDFEVEYLCVLDEGCSGRDHSLNCQDLNRKRAVAMLARERRSRRARIEADITGPVL